MPVERHLTPPFTGKETFEGDPVKGCHLVVRAQGEGRFEREDEGVDREAGREDQGPERRKAREEPPIGPQVQPDLLPRLPDRRVEVRAIPGAAATSGEGYVPAPGVSLLLGTLDEEQIRARSEDGGNRCVRVDILQDGILTDPTLAESVEEMPQLRSRDRSP